MRTLRFPPIALLASLASLALAATPAIAAGPITGGTGAPPPVRYERGAGLRVEPLGLHVGGFLIAELEDERGGPTAIELEGPTFLVGWEAAPWLRLFSEIDLDGIARWDSGDDRWEHRLDVDLERLWVEATRGDAYRLRVGKFRTPVGRWNQVRAEPFVWTTSEPLLVEVPIDETLTGAVASVTSFRAGVRATFSLFAQATDPLAPEALDEEDLPPLERVLGTRLELASATETWSLAASTALAGRHGDLHALGALDGEAHLDVLARSLELTAEAVVAGGGVAGRELWGFYLQGVYEAVPTVYLVARYEHFDPRGRTAPFGDGDRMDDDGEGGGELDDDGPGAGEPDLDDDGGTDRGGRTVDVLDLGIAWTPLPELRLKAGYRLVSARTEAAVPGLSASISWLF